MRRGLMSASIFPPADKWSHAVRDTTRTLSITSEKRPGKRPAFFARRAGPGPRAGACGSGLRSSLVPAG